MAEAKYRPGHEITTWPEEKFARALQHLSELRSQIQLWSARAHVDRDCIVSEDGRRVDVVLRIAHRPPLSQWSLALGDFIHNLRASLDSLTWDLATLSGSQPTAPSRVQFPVYGSSSKWHKFRDDVLATIPEPALERIAMTQPFNHDPPEQSALYILHELDIWDKHRSLIHVRFIPNSIKLDGMEVQLAETGIELDAPSFAIDESPIDDGERLFSITFNQPVVSATAPVGIELRPEVEFGDKRLNLNVVISNLVNQVRTILSLVKFGTEYNPELEFTNASDD